MNHLNQTAIKWKEPKIIFTDTSSYLCILYGHVNCLGLSVPSPYQSAPLHSTPPSLISGNRSRRRGKRRFSWRRRRRDVENRQQHGSPTFLAKATIGRSSGLSTSKTLRTRSLRMCPHHLCKNNNRPCFWSLYIKNITDMITEKKNQLQLCIKNIRNMISGTGRMLYHSYSRNNP